MSGYQPDADSREEIEDFAAYCVAVALGVIDPWPWWFRAMAMKPTPLVIRRG